MKRIPALTFAFLAAVLAPTLAITLYFIVVAVIAASQGSATGSAPQVVALVFVSALFISAGHVGVLGMPAVWMLNRWNRLNLWSALVAGFVLGCIPMAIWNWPYESEFKSSSRYWDGKTMVDAKIDGVLTVVGWIDYLQGVAFMGIFGVIAAAAFWWTFEFLRPATAVASPTEPSYQ